MRKTALPSVKESKLSSVRLTTSKAETVAVAERTRKAEVENFMVYKEGEFQGWGTSQKLYHLRFFVCTREPSTREGQRANWMYAKLNENDLVLFAFSFHSIGILSVRNFVRKKKYDQLSSIRVLSLCIIMTCSKILKCHCWVLLVASFPASEYSEPTMGEIEKETSCHIWLCL